MFRTITLTTALAVFAMVPATPAAAAVGVAQLLLEEHYSEGGYEVDLYVTRSASGEILTEATITDPASGEAVDLWTDGTTVWWHGMSGGKPVEGSMPERDIAIAPEELFCFTPATAILCVGAVILVAASSSCAHQSWCVRDEGTNTPGGHGGVPPEYGGDGDGDGDRSSSGGSGSGGGGDED